MGEGRIKDGLKDSILGGYLETHIIQKTEVGVWVYFQQVECKASKEVKPVNLKGNQPWIFIERTGVETEAPVLWPPDAKWRLTGKDPDAWKDWGQEEKRAAEDEMVGWHHQLNEHQFTQTLGDSEGQGSLACCSPWGHKESDTT